MAICARSCDCAVSRELVSGRKGSVTSSRERSHTTVSYTRGGDYLYPIRYLYSKPDLKNHTLEVTSDRILLEIQKAKTGKQSAYSFLLNNFWSEVYGFQLKRTDNAYDAEDITIQTFSRAFDKLHTFKEEYTFSTWLITISKNIHIDILRKKESSIRSQFSDRDDDKVRKVADENLSPEDALIKEQNLAQLLSYIKNLKPHYQEMINLRYFQEMSYNEMADHIGEPINNVKVKLLRARRLLSDIIKKVEQ